MKHPFTIIGISLGVLALVMVSSIGSAGTVQAMHMSLGPSIRLCVQDLKEIRSGMGDLTFEERKELRREFRMCVKDAIKAFLHRSSSSRSSKSKSSHMSKSSKSSRPSSSMTSHSSMSSSLSSSMNSSLSSMSSASSLQQVNIDVDDDFFSPSSVTVKQGTTVRWENEGDEDHTVTGDSAGGPNSGTLDPGESYTFTFSSTGSYPYHCNFHPSMMGSVMVIE